MRSLTDTSEPAPISGEFEQKTYAATRTNDGRSACPSDDLKRYRPPGEKQAIDADELELADADRMSMSTPISSNRSFWCATASLSATSAEPTAQRGDGDPIDGDDVVTHIARGCCETYSRYTGGALLREIVESKRGRSDAILMGEGVFRDE